MKADNISKEKRIKKAFTVTKWKEGGDWLEEGRILVFTWIGVLCVLGWLSDLCGLDYSKTTVYLTALLLDVAIHLLLKQIASGQERLAVGGILAFTLVMLIMPPVLRGISGLFHDASNMLAKQGIHLFFAGSAVEQAWNKTLVMVILATWFLLIFRKCYGKIQWITIAFLIMLIFEMRVGAGDHIRWMILWLFWLFILLFPTMRSYLYAAVPLMVLAIVFATVFGIQGGSGWKNIWEHWRYGSRVAVLPSGDLTAAGNMKRSDKTALTLEGDADGYYYLKGFVGTIYEENQWKTDGQMLEDFETGILSGNHEFLSWLHEKGYSGWNALSHRLQAEKLAAAEKETIVTIKNKRANRRYLYLPYELTTTVKQLEKEGLAVSSAGESLLSRGLRGKKQYRVKTASSYAGEEITKTDRSKNEQLKEYDAYEEYVNRSCLSLPKEVKETLRIELGGNTTIGIDDTMAIVAKVRKWVRENISYSEKPGTVPADREFTQWFLEGNAGGYDVQYATLGVMLFRYYGIPSRYVEGYLVENTAEIPENAAHAWPEIFLTGRGWVPVEIMEDYQRRMPSYLPEKGEKLFSSGNSMEPEEGEQKEQPKKHAGDSSGKEKTEQVKKKPAISILPNDDHAIPMILLFALFILAIIAAFLLIFLGIREIYFRKWATESISADRSIIMWYRYCIWVLYELEEDPVLKTDMSVDNRVSRWEERWKKYHPEVSVKELHKAALCRQKAIYNRKGVQWHEVNQGIVFFKNEYQYLYKKLSLGGKIRIRLGLRPPFLRK